MRILFDNVFFGSRSGPNTFGTRLARSLSLRNHTVVEAHENPDVQLTFIQAANFPPKAPMVQRLDGIWFNSAQDWSAMNAPIMDPWEKSRAVIYQSEFDKKLIEKFFGHHANAHVIHNGTDINFIQSCDPLDVPTLQGVDKIWACASAWRPHKRLKDNIRYFFEHSGPRDVLIIAGANPDVMIADPRIFYAGDLEHKMLIPLLRATDFFIHCAWLDHSPNIVVDARAAGAHIICSSSGGTSEIAGPDATIIDEDLWEIAPCKLYEPPEMDFSRKVRNHWDVPIDITEKAEMYEKVLQGVI